MVHTKKTGVGLLDGSRTVSLKSGPSKVSRGTIVGSTFGYLQREHPKSRNRDFF